MRTRSGEDFSEEIEAHLVLETDRLVAQGLSRDEARAAALRAFGSVTRARERFHEASRWVWVEQLQQDVRYAARVLAQSPTFLATAIMTLAAGLTAVTVVFTVFNAYFLKPYAIRSPETLHRIGWQSRATFGETFRWRDYEAIRDRSDLFDAVVAQDIQLVTSGGRPLVAALVSETYFDALSPRISLGRGLARFDTQEAVAAAVITDLAWDRLFARDPGILGRQLDLSGHQFTIVGVAGPAFVGLGDTPADLWIPLTAYAALVKPELTGPAQPRSVDLLAHVREGIGVEQVRGALTPMLAGAVAGQQDIRAWVRAEPTPAPLHLEGLLLLAPVFAAFGLVLVTASANLSNVMLARAIARHREIAVRLSLGASRSRIIRQLLTEGLVIALLAAAAGLALSAWVLRAGSAMFLGALPPSFGGIIRLAPMTIDARVFTFALAAAAAATLLFALVPAVQASRLPLTAALRGHGVGALRSSRLRSGLVVGQVTVSVVLVIAAFTFARQGSTLGAVDLGYETTGVVSVTLRGGQDKVLVPKLAAVLGADPRVAGVAATSANPLKRSAGSGLLAAGPTDGQAVVPTAHTFVSPEYFTILEIPIERGRPFRADEASGGAAVAIVSAATARALWPGQDPVGRTLRIEAANGRPVRYLPGYSNVTVVGTTPDVVSGFIVDGVDPGHIYLPMAATHPRASGLIVRGYAGRELGPAILQELFGRVAVDAQAFEALPLDELRRMQMFPVQVASVSGMVLGGVALLLSVAGLYGVLTYSVSQRTREIGIRVALGARTGVVIGLVMRQSVRLAGAGAALGLLVAFSALHALDSAIELRTISMLDGVAFVAGVVVVLSTTGLAAFQPARRAARVDPAITLRADG